MEDIFGDNNVWLTSCNFYVRETLILCDVSTEIADQQQDDSEIWKLQYIQSKDALLNTSEIQNLPYMQSKDAFLNTLVFKHKLHRTVDAELECIAVTTFASISFNFELTL